MREFGPFQMCHPSRTDKLFGQPKQGHTHTQPVTRVQAVVAQHQCFVLLLCVPAARGNVEKSFVGVCESM